jgi:protein-S-isoprenylcysteine O-methyltransferase Ste14
MEHSGPLPPTYLLVGLLAIVALHFTHSGPRLIGAAWRLLGLPVVILGLVLTVRADALFKRVGTEIKPFRDSSRIVSEDLYGISRHPMYLGFILLLAGVAILAGTLFPLLVLGVMFWLFMVRFVLPEERHMEQQFGAEYREYKSRVRMWL